MLPMCEQSHAGKKLGLDSVRLVGKVKKESERTGKAKSRSWRLRHEVEKESKK